MKVEIQPLTLTHLADMGVELDAANRALLTGFDRAECFALLIDGEPVAAGGITQIRDGVGLAWTKQTEQVGNSAFLFRRVHQAIKKIFPVVLDGMGLERIEAHAKADNRKACRWLEYFGFDLEAPRMRRFSGGEDYALYARIKS